MEGMNALGYPPYFVLILGVWKILGAIVVLIPGTPRLKEWAYAGMVFDLTGAAASHAFVGEASKIAAPLIITAVVMASWALPGQPQASRCQGQADVITRALNTAPAGWFDTLTVEYADGPRKVFKAGQGFPQARSKWHRGRNDGETVVRLSGCVLRR